MVHFKCRINQERNLMKLKELESKVGGEVVYAPPGRWTSAPIVVNLVGIAPIGTVRLRDGYSKNRLPYAIISYGNANFTEKVPMGHISDMKPARLRELNAENEAAEAASAARDAARKAEMVKVEERLIELGVIERGAYSRLRYSNTLDLSFSELSALVALVPDGVHAVPADVMESMEALA